MYHNLFLKRCPKRKKGAAVPEVSAAGAAALVGVIGMAIVLYIILIPPEARQELLGDKPYSYLPGQSSPSNEIVESGFNKTLVLENIGEVDYIKQREIEHPIPALNLYTTTSGSLIKEENSLYVKNTLFSREFKTVDFLVKELDNTENVLLNFLVKESNGRLIIKLNGNEILNNEITTTNIQPIKLRSELLKESNVLEFEVESPKFMFWRVNEYSIEKLTITGDVTDITKREAKSTFFVEPEEMSSAEKAVIEFYPDCNKKKVGKLSVSLNRREVFNAIPDCNILNKQIFPVSMLENGNNIIQFFAESGDYYIDNIKISVDLKEPDNYIYYFNMDEKYFNEIGDEEPLCGESDGICPDDCDADLDKDCCFEASSKNYWCDAIPNEIDDRCVSSVSFDRCQLCSSGYEDEDNEPAEECENLCGDDEDGICPIGCNKYDDKDCCFLSSKNYWCDDVPKGLGIQGVCLSGVSKDQCNYCESGYEDRYGDEPDCDSKKTSDEVTYDLKSKYGAYLKIEFVPDNEIKQGEIVINDNKIYFDTREDDYERQIDTFLRPDYNVVQLIPKSSMNVVQFEVKLKER